MIHPRIQSYIDKVKKSDVVDVKIDVLSSLNDLGATETEAIFVLHQGFGMSLDNAQSFVFGSGIFEGELVQDIADQTFIFSNYDPDSKYIDNSDQVKYPMKREKRPDKDNG
jgi:hypothetical protein